MKATYARRYRSHSSSSREGKMFKKDYLQEQMFFGAPSQQSFFKPTLAIQRKCTHCDTEDKIVRRMAGDKEEEKNIQKMSDQKEDAKLQRQPGKKEEEKIQRQPEKKEDEKVMRATDPTEEEKKLQRQPEKKEEENIQKMEDKKEEKELQRSPGKEEEKNIAKKEARPTSSPATHTGNYIRSLNGKGRELPKESQYFFGKRMGYDFSQVKIHTGAEAEQSAKDVNAKAYCIDNNIVFNKGQYNPASADGKKLLAHELTHVMQQHDTEPGLLNRVAQLTEKEKEEKPVDIAGQATKTKQKTSYGCGDIQVSGQTDANYKSSFKTKGKTKTSDECSDCSAPDCITSSGTVISTFKSKPVITLPDVPDGLTKCEARAVRKFINGTLKKHEQQHKKAFQTYDGVVKTPYEFTGCKSELSLLVQSIHDGIDTQRSTDANALSDALDPFNAPIPCDCE